ncbi:MAG: hypothetical protein WA624_08345, partial [Methylocella sp.]
GYRRLGVLGLREAMGYAMTCRRRPFGHGEAKVTHAWLWAQRSAAAGTRRRGKKGSRLGRVDGKLVRKQ